MICQEQKNKCRDNNCCTHEKKKDLPTNDNQFLLQNATVSVAIDQRHLFYGLLQCLLPRLAGLLVSDGFLQQKSIKMRFIFVTPWYALKWGPSRRYTYLFMEGNRTAKQAALKHRGIWRLWTVWLLQTEQKNKFLTKTVRNKFLGWEIYRSLNLYTDLGEIYSLYYSW